MKRFLRIRTFKSKIWAGKFDIIKVVPTILLNENLQENKRPRVIAHEYEHYRFFRSWIGKAVYFTYDLKLRVLYIMLLVSSFFLNAFLFLFFSIPMYVRFVEEICISIRYPSKLSLTLSLFQIWLYLCAFMFRLVW